MFDRDGTSQAGRVLPALDPGYVAVDERSARDLLELTQAYAKELRYYNGQNQPDGDWSGFLGSEDLRGLAALVESSAPAQGSMRVDRPHLALFLTFLRLLRYRQDLVNGLTRQHLTFYYSQLLLMTRKPAVADRVHIVVKLAAGGDRVRLLQGTALRAGKDSQGKEQMYRLDREVVLGRARLARLSSVYARREVIGLRDARERSVNDGAQSEIVLDHEPAAATSDRLFHIHPFGASPVAADAVTGVTPLLPRHDHEGELYLGIEGIRPPATLSLLFQMAEGSADPWAYEDSADIVIGGKIFANSSVNFLAGRDYVDFVANIELFRIDGGALISDAEYTAASFTGIDYMKIGPDVAVAGSA